MSWLCDARILDTLARRLGGLATTEVSGRKPVFDWRGATSLKDNVLEACTTYKRGSPTLPPPPSAIPGADNHGVKRLQGTVSKP